MNYEEINALRNFHKFKALQNMHTANKNNVIFDLKKTTRCTFLSNLPLP